MFTILSAFRETVNELHYIALHATNLMSPSRNSSDPTCNPEISGRKETSLQRRVSYAITLHFLQTRATRQISRWDKYEKILSSTLSGNFSIVCNIKHFDHICLLQQVIKSCWWVKEAMLRQEGHMQGEG